jgi:hypothetical protein
MSKPVIELWSAIDRNCGTARTADRLDEFYTFVCSQIIPRTRILTKLGEHSRLLGFSFAAKVSESSTRTSKP